MVVNQPQQDKSRAVGLQDLQHVELSERNARMLTWAREHAVGDPFWKVRMEMEARELLALSQIVPEERLEVGILEMERDLRAMIRLKVPVPLEPQQNNQLRIASEALVALRYPREALTRTLPGYLFVSIVAPHEVWLPQVKRPEQVFCVMAEVRAGTPVKALVLATYGALAMQSIQINELDPAGVFLPEAALWWQQDAGRHRLPLTDTALLAPSSQEVKR